MYNRKYCQGMLAANGRFICHYVQCALVEQDLYGLLGWKRYQKPDGYGIHRSGVREGVWGYQSPLTVTIQETVTEHIYQLQEIKVDEIGVDIMDGLTD